MRVFVKIELWEKQNLKTDDKIRFWSAVGHNKGRTDEKFADRMEENFLEEFPQLLKQNIIRGLETRLSQLKNADQIKLWEERPKRWFDIPPLGYEQYFEYRNQLKIVAETNFYVADLHYASLNFALIFGAFETALDFYDKNFEFIEPFLSQYIPETFYEMYRQPVDVSYWVPLRQDRFSSGQQANPAKQQKGNWLWRLSNFSLLIPAGLAIWLYCTYADRNDALDGKREKMYNNLFDKQDKIIERYGQMLDRCKEAKPPLPVPNPCCCPEKPPQVRTVVKKVKVCCDQQTVAK